MAKINFKARRRKDLIHNYFKKIKLQLTQDNKIDLL